VTSPCLRGWVLPQNLSLHLHTRLLGPKKPPPHPPAMHPGSNTHMFASSFKASWYFRYSGFPNTWTQTEKTVENPQSKKKKKYIKGGKTSAQPSDQSAGTAPPRCSAGAYPSAVAGTLVPIQQGVDQGFADAFEGGAGISQLQQVGTEVLPY